MSGPKNILIVGGGLTGLTAARELSRHRELAVTLVESGNDLGGLAASFPLLGTSLEKAYHHLFRTDEAILNLINDLGLSERLMWCESSVGIYLGGRIHPFMSPLDLLRFKPCSLLSRLRLGAVMFYLQKTKNWRPLASQTAHQWMTRACGPEVMRTIWTPLLKGKFDRYYDAVSMAWLWARIHVRANSRGGGGGRERLGYLRGGLVELIKALESDLTKQEVRILTGTAVQRLESGETRRAVLADGRTIPFDVCLFTGSSAALAAILPEDPAYRDYARKLESIQYLEAACLVFVSDQSLAEQYWLNIHEPDAPFLLFVHHTRLVDPALYQGKHVYYIGCYQPEDSPLLTTDESVLSDKWFGYLRKILPDFDRSRVTERHLFRFKAAQHIVDTRYAEKIPDYRTPVPGVFLANFSQVFPEDRGTNYAVREGLKVAGLIQQELNLGGRT